MLAPYFVLGPTVAPHFFNSRISTPYLFKYIDCCMPTHPVDSKAWHLLHRCIRATLNRRPVSAKKCYTDRFVQRYNLGSYYNEIRIPTDTIGHWL